MSSTGGKGIIDALAGLGLLWLVVAGLLALLWAFLPLAVYGIKRRLDAMNTRLTDFLQQQAELIEQQRKAQETLESILEENVMLRHQQLELAIRQSSCEDDDSAM